MGAKEIPLVQGTPAEPLRAMATAVPVHGETTRQVPLRILEDLEAHANGAVIAIGTMEADEEVSGVVAPAEAIPAPEAPRPGIAATLVADDVLSGVLRLEEPLIRNRAPAGGRAQRPSVLLGRVAQPIKQLEAATKILVDLAADQPRSMPATPTRAAIHRIPALTPTVGAAPLGAVAPSDQRVGSVTRLAPRALSARRRTATSSAVDAAAVVATTAPLRPRNRPAATAPEASQPPAARPIAATEAVVPNKGLVGVSGFADARVNAGVLPAAAPPAA